MNKFAAMLFFVFSTQVSADTHCDSQCQLTLIKDYYQKINLSVVQQSTTENVDVFLGSLHEDVVYLHEEYEAKFDKTIWRKAFLRQMERGGYANTVEANTVLKSVIHGYQTAAVEFVSQYRNQEDTEVTSSPSRLAIFKFKDSKIVFIQDHWYHLAEETLNK